mgnify:CR=1 FL=1
MSAKYVQHPIEQQFHARSRRKLLIFDADGTLRRCTVAGQPCPNKPSEWELLPGVKDLLARYKWAPDLMLGVASNQGGVGLGLLSEETATNLLVDMYVEITGCWPPSHMIQVCPHAPTAGCDCRKPKPLMLQRIMRAAGEFSPEETTFIGDQAGDEQAAAAARCSFIWARDFFGWDDGVTEVLSDGSVLGADPISAAIRRSSY